MAKLCLVGVTSCTVNSGSCACRLLNHRLEGLVNLHSVFVGGIQYYIVVVEFVILVLK